MTPMLAMTVESARRIFRRNVRSGFYVKNITYDQWRKQNADRMKESIEKLFKKTYPDVESNYEI